MSVTPVQPALHHGHGHPPAILTPLICHQLPGLRTVHTLRSSNLLPTVPGRVKAPATLGGMAVSSQASVSPL